MNPVLPLHHRVPHKEKQLWENIHALGVSLNRDALRFLKKLP